jgi:hypothetical protein
MPQIIIERVDSTEVQGEGSYVMLLKLKHGQTWALQAEMAAASKANDTRPLEDLLSRQVVGWNWANADGVPFALPKDDPEVLDELTEDELVFLAQSLLSVSGAKAKN